jgi:dipeptidyl aminopeptidase/acylaminoacyl peptidase
MNPAQPKWEQRFRAPTPSFPTWSRHAPNRLVYVSNESGSYQAHTLDLVTNERRRVSDCRIGLWDAMPTADGTGAVWFEDDTGDERGRWLVAPFSAGRPEPLLPDLAPGWQMGIALGRDVIVAVRADQEGYALHAVSKRGATHELYRRADALHLGGSTERTGFNLGGLSADESLVCLEDSEQGDEIRRALRVLDARSGDVVGELWDGRGYGLQAQAWSPVEGDQRIALRHERLDRARPALWDLGRDERTDLDVQLPGDVTPLDWWPDGGALLLSHLMEGRHELFRLELATGDLERIEHPPGTIDDARVRPDGDVWLHVSSGGSPPRVLTQATEEVLLADEHGPEGVPFRSWTFPNQIGDRVHGFYAAPSGSGPYPIVMYVHGGPTGHDADRWDPYVQALVDHGFAVGLVNYRGSDGYGRAWRDFLVGNIGLPEEEDVIAGLEDLVARDVADPERAVIGGWSWGGYVTLLSIGRSPQRWRAAIGGVPVGDYEACYDELSPELQAYDRYLLGGMTPREVPELMAERSPINYVERVRTPTLVLAARNDVRCPYRQAVAWVQAVRALGVEVELYEYDSGHVSWDVDEIVRQVRVILEFLARHVPTS